MQLLSSCGSHHSLFRSLTERFWDPTPETVPRRSQVWLRNPAFSQISHKVFRPFLEKPCPGDTMAERYRKQKHEVSSSPFPTYQSILWILFFFLSGGPLSPFKADSTELEYWWGVCEWHKGKVRGRENCTPWVGWGELGEAGVAHWRREAAAA